MSAVKKILITGGSGFLGQYLNIELSKKFEILTLYKSNPGNCKKYNNYKLDINDHDLLKQTFNQFNPDVAIHTAAVSSPNKTDKISAKEVYSTNVNSTQKIAELCRDNNCRMIYTSTDLVYAGYRGSLLDEKSKLIPATLYAETKLVGEKKIRETFENYVILRTALLIGVGLNGRKNHFHQMFEDLKSGRKVKLFTDQYRSSLYVKDAARMISLLIDKNIQSETINFGGNERVSRYQIGEILCEEAGHSKSLLEKITMDDIPGFTKVEDVSLNIKKLKSFGILPMNFREAVKDILRN